MSRTPSPARFARLALPLAGEGRGEGARGREIIDQVPDAAPCSIGRGPALPDDSRECPPTSPRAVESATLGWFECLGYRIVNGPDIAPDGSSPLRQSFADVVLGSPLADAISRINPDLPASAVDDVVRKVVRGQRCIDKSVFRRNIGRRERIAPGRPTVNYIREHFELAWVVLPQSEIAILERDLIARIAAKWDLYNLDGNPLAPRRRTQEAVSQLSAG